MLFELFGNKGLVDTLIRIPICSAEQPASVLKRFAAAWPKFKDSPEANSARQNSQKQAEPRLSKQIYKLQKQTDRGRWIAEWVAADWNNWYQLTHADQHLWAEYTSGIMEQKIAELRTRKQPKFPGHLPHGPATT